ncbi:glycosyltransferase family 2 protein [Blastococcus goldschmidtiae]|uniref:glycosyltransferase family 2 protein n=1 Tax=Blastococcus goldschmidtiae TaxID=3075546 RepID=UPI0037BEE740
MTHRVDVEVSILIVSYNAEAFLRDCLDSIASARHTDASWEVVIVDNASDAATRRLVESHPAVQQRILLPLNVGFAAAVNLAARSATGRNLLLLNPDTHLYPGTIEAALSRLHEHPDIGVLGGRTLYPDGRVDPASCWGAPSLWSHVSFALGLSALLPNSVIANPEEIGGWDRSTFREVGVVTGCFLLISRELWDRLGGFDETFFMYGEDADLTIRARALGYRPSIEPTAVLTHSKGASSSSAAAKSILLYRGKVSIVKRHMTRPRRWLCLISLYVGVAVRAGASRITASGMVYRHLWEKRHDWLGGWEAQPRVSLDGRSHPDRDTGDGGLNAGTEP